MRRPRRHRNGCDAAADMVGVSWVYGAAFTRGGGGDTGDTGADTGADTG